MDRVLEIFGCTDTSLKAQAFLIYVACAVLVTVLVNWALATLFLVVKPFTCAAILLTFFRPDIAQNFLNEDFLSGLADKTKTLFCEIFVILLKLGEQFRRKFV